MIPYSAWAKNFYAVFRRFATRSVSPISLLNSLYNLLSSVKPPRPIVFVAHSMGGVVLKAALAEAQHSNAAILEATRGIIFFGTPRFTDANDWVSFSQSICAKRTEPTSPKKFAKLVYIDDDFSRLHDNRQFRVSCFFEDLPVYRQGIVRDKPCHSRFY